MNPLDPVLAHRIVPVVVLDKVADAEPLAAALVAGGLPVAEVTFRTPAAADCLRIMAGYPGLVVGAGTVRTVEQADAAAAAGATFLVSPGSSLPVVRHARDDLQLPLIPGAVTPTELTALLDEGIDTVKFFPAGAFGGPKTIAALAAPFHQVSFIPTGGVGPANLADYLALPSVVGVGGSWMVPSDVIAAGDFDRITELCRAAVDLATAARP